MASLMLWRRGVSRVCCERPVRRARAQLLSAEAAEKKTSSGDSDSSSSSSSATDSSSSSEAREGWNWAPYVVFGILGSLGAWFWRASTGQANRRRVLEDVEARRALSSSEKKGLREANGGLTAEVFADVGQGCARQFGGLEAKLSYPAFVRCATAYLDEPLKQGHLLDRVVASSRRDDDDVELGFFVAALGLAVAGSADERAAAYAKILGDTASRTDLESLLRWLEEAGHVPPDVLVTEAAPNYPAQHYALKSPAHLLDDLDIRPSDGDLWNEEHVVAALTSKALRIT